MKEASKEILTQAISKIMRPVVRMLLARGVAYREFTELSKRIFYEVGNEMLEATVGKKTDSQLSVLTGVHRKDISLFKTMKADTIVKSHSLGAALVAEWITNPLYVDGDGKPKPLPYSGKSGSFVSLVEGVSKDIRPRAHLDELLRLNLVEVKPDNTVTLVTNVFLPSGDFGQKVDFFCRNVGDHLSAATQNLQHSVSPYFDRSAFHTNLSAEQIEAVRAIVDEQGMELLKMVYRRAEELASHSEEAKEPKRRFTVGLFMYDEAVHNETK